MRRIAPVWAAAYAEKNPGRFTEIKLVHTFFIFNKNDF
jgi:hypothetical protein